MLSALLAMQQADAAFPSGAFAFSNGIEGLTALLFNFDGAALRRHAEAAIRHRWASTDRLALVQAHRAGGALERLAAIDAALECATLAEPLRTGSRRAGRALLASHARLGTAGAGPMRTAIAGGHLLGHLATVQGCLWHALGLSEEQAVAVAGYQAISGLASAALRLGRVGAIEAQAVVRDMLPVIAACDPVDADDNGLDFTSFVPLIEIGAMRSTSADVRLFAN